MVTTFKNSEIFSIYYFSYMRGYKAALRGGNKCFQNIMYGIEIVKEKLQQFERNFNL